MLENYFHQNNKAQNSAILTPAIWTIVKN